MNIKLVGWNCSNGIKLKKVINKLIKKTEYNIELELLDSESEAKKWNVKNKPGLIINNVLISQGKTFSDRDIIKYLRLVNS